jgi:hypothetical protein
MIEKRFRMAAPLALPAIVQSVSTHVFGDFFAGWTGPLWGLLPAR